MENDLATLCSNLIDNLINALKQYQVLTNYLTIGPLNYDAHVSNYHTEVISLMRGCENSKNQINNPDDVITIINLTVHLIEKVSYKCDGYIDQAYAEAAPCFRYTKSRKEVQTQSLYLWDVYETFQNGKEPLKALVKTIHHQYFALICAIGQTSNN